MSITLKIKNKSNSIVDALCPKCNREVSIGYFINSVCFRCEEIMPFYTRNIINYTRYRLNYHLGQNIC